MPTAHAMEHRPTEHGCPPHKLGICRNPAANRGLRSSPSMAAHPKTWTGSTPSLPSGQEFPRTYAQNEASHSSSFRPAKWLVYPTEGWRDCLSEYSSTRVG